ncbi:hypothetical protein Glove_101g24 [Diversispora epigaea]|uniref:MnmE helical domain-containing protein n=1 Tax=Diversispora epigaea TaxID=1348612 RepID=A0A397J3W3_9GLOM|nr:hypothetical protein Glove_101g24 [Diversispora epigaea]
MIYDAMDKDTILILNKTDLLNKTELSYLKEIFTEVVPTDYIFCLSCITGEGIKEFLEFFVTSLRHKYDDSTSQVALITQARHREHLNECVKGLRNFLDPMIYDAMDKDTILILNKTDLLNKTELSYLKEIFTEVVPTDYIFCLSCITGEGIKEFLEFFVTSLRHKYDDSTSQVALITQARHREHLNECVKGLRNFLGRRCNYYYYNYFYYFFFFIYEQEFSKWLKFYAILENYIVVQNDLVLAAEELRYATNALGKITGRVSVDEILSVIFQQFCIGK